ncbi:MAG: OmpH family outer membrane protein [candidate division WOR-3 bacterium]|nr:OmpH family outer membrane protein [candidate division WOR-3 bacterium]MDW8113325.1 OmpH family outer membrane protein [candidate division WOR-3 bacterium]
MIYFLILLNFLFFKEIKIGYVDMDRILKDYEEAKEVLNQLQKDIDQWEKEADSLKDLLNKSKEELEVKKLMLTEEGLKIEMEKINNISERYNNFLYEIWGKGGRLERRQNELIMPLVKKINEVIQKIAESEGFTIVFDASVTKVLYAEPGLDITELVLTELNKEYAKKEGKIIKEVLVAVLPIYESEARAKEEKLGEYFYNNLIAFLKRNPNLKLTDKEDIENALVRHNLKKGDKIERNTAFLIGQELSLDYIVYGNVSGAGKKIICETKIIDIKNNNDIAIGKAEGGNKEEALRKLNDLIGRAFYRLIK